MKKSLNRNVPAPVFVQLCQQLTVGAAGPAAAGEAAHGIAAGSCCAAVKGPKAAPLSVMERLIQVALAWPEESSISMTLEVF